MNDTDQWMTRTSDGNIVKGIEFARFDTTTAGVAVDGFQDIEGVIVERSVSLYDVNEMDANQARALAAALLAAADHLDKLTGEAPPFQ